jgi:glycosyltransferase involved in cell wall biosynthesis
MLRVLHICHSFEYGGITTFVKALIELNDDVAQHSVLVWNKKLDKNYQSNIHFIDISQLKHLKENRLKEICSEYQVVCYHSIHPFMLSALNTHKQKSFIFQHGLTLGNKFIRKILKFLFYHWIVNFRLFPVIYSSDFAFQKLRKKLLFLRKNKAIIIPFGITMNQKPEFKINSFDSEKNEFIIGCAGHLTAQKRVNLIIQALNKYKGITNIELRIAGTGPELKRLNEISDFPASVKVNFLGHVEKMHAFYKGLDLFIHAGHNESYGLAVLEALAYGVPSIVFKDSGACVDFIDQNYSGFVVDSSSSLLEKITDLVDGKEFQIIKKKINPASIQKKYDIKNTRDKIHALIKAK